jgi:hypothetical protein
VAFSKATNHLNKTTIQIVASIKEKDSLLKDELPSGDSFNGIGGAGIVSTTFFPSLARACRLLQKARRSKSYCLNQPFP